MLRYPIKFEYVERITFCRLSGTGERERKKGMDGVNWEVGVERLFGNFRGLD